MAVESLVDCCGFGAGATAVFQRLEAMDKTVEEHRSPILFVCQRYAKPEASFNQNARLFFALFPAYYNQDVAVLSHLTNVLGLNFQ